MALKGAGLAIIRLKIQLFYKSNEVRMQKVCIFALSN